MFPSSWRGVTQGQSVVPPPPPATAVPTETELLLERLTHCRDHSRLYPLDYQLFKEILIGFHQTDLPDIYLTAMQRDSSYLSVDFSVYKQVTLCAEIRGKITRTVTFTPRHPVWKDVSAFPQNARLLAEWRQWAATPTPTPEQRQEAMQSMEKCLLSDDQSLILDNRQLTSLPNHLPPWLTSLSVANNRLTYLPLLPPNLEALDVHCNQLTALPPALPLYLQTLNAGDNQLRSLPELPRNLRSLIIINNLFTLLPELPPYLRLLNANNNNLTCLPELPLELISLHVYANRLTTLPQLPRGLYFLDISHNQLTHRPVIDIPGHTLLCTGNPFTVATAREIPVPAESKPPLDSAVSTTPLINALPARPHIALRPPGLQPPPPGTSYQAWWKARGFLAGQHISTPPVVSQPTLLPPAMTQPTARPPVMSTQVTRKILPPPTSQIRGKHSRLATEYRPILDTPGAFTLTDAVLAWYPPEHYGVQQSAWKTISFEVHSPAFTRFLAQLRQGSVCRTHGFREKVVDWLNELATDPELRKRTFTIAFDNSSNCSERATLVWNVMQVNCLLYHAEQHPQRIAPSAFLTLARQAFRFLRLQEEATNKALTLPMDEDSEALHLELLTRLKAPLGLPDILTGTINAPLLTAADLTTVLTAIHAAESRHFRHWLSIWPPCQTYALQQLSAQERQAFLTYRLNLYREKVAVRRAEHPDWSDAQVNYQAGVITEGVVFRPLIDALFFPNETRSGD